MLRTDEQDPQLLGQRLAQARKARGMTQDEAANQLGVSRPTLSATEKGKRPPKPEELVRLAELYGRSVHDLIGRKAPTVELAPHLRAAVRKCPEAENDVDDAIKEFESLADDYRELEQLLGAEPVYNYPPQIGLPDRARQVDEFAEDVAERERKRLAVGDQPILGLRRVLEDSVGLKVFCTGIPSHIAGMYAYVEDLGCLILMNRNHPQERQRWTLSHEYGHFLLDRHRPGVDYTREKKRKPANKRFCDAFAANFLLPRSAVRSRFYDIKRSTNDFRVADLCQLSSDFAVSVHAMARRLEALNLIDKGSWRFLQEKGFQPTKAKEELEIGPTQVESQDIYPQRYKYLAVTAFCEEKITETELARFLRTDRVSARGIVRKCVHRLELTEEGGEGVMRLPFEKSLLKTD